jgi:hypothetical protein
MKNKLIFLTVIALAAIGFMSCDKDASAGLTRVTYYPIITVLGDEVTVIDKGDTYTDLGVYAELNGEDVSSQVETVSNVNTADIGIYTVSYKVTNTDGFSAVATRTVFVVDRNSLASAYFGESQYGAHHYYDAPIIIKDNGNGTYTIDDLAGGFYFWGRYPGYEPTYDFHCEAILSLSSTTITLNGYAGSWYWAPDFPSITSGTYNPQTGVVTLVLDFSGTPMYVTLTK